tara:strand:+ start:224 stop:478 length:255 start_codon:yes stop_codon:yes gene_type:complete
VVKVKSYISYTVTVEGFLLELNLFDEVFMGSLSESTSFISVKVYVITPEGDLGAASLGVSAGAEAVASAIRRLEFDVDFYFVVL